MKAIDALWRHAHLALVALAEGGTASWNSATGHGKPESKAPAAAGVELREFEHDWANADNDRERLAVIRRVIHELKAHRPRVGHGLVRGTEEWRREIAHDDRPIREVAKAWEVKKETVSKYRHEFLEAPRKPGRPKQEIRR